MLPALAKADEIRRW